MDRARLEWIMSGLTRYNLTKNEDQFIVSAERDFNQKNMLTEQQEERLEVLYKDKSRFIPNKTYFTPKESSSPKKTRVQRPRVKVFS
jgi:DNA repair ATPase RecN